MWQKANILNLTAAVTRTRRVTTGLSVNYTWYEGNRTR